MRTVRSNIKKGFEAGGGIRPDVPVRNSGLFEECKQARMCKVGLEGYVPDVNDVLDPARKFYDSVTLAEFTLKRRWPFPQVFMTDSGIYIGALEGLYKVLGAPPSGYPDLSLYSFGTGATVWPWVSIGSYGNPIFTSGTRFVYYDPETQAYVVVS